MKKRTRVIMALGVSLLVVSVATIRRATVAQAGGLTFGLPVPPIGDPLVHPLDPLERMLIARKLERMPADQRAGFLFFMRHTYLKRNR